MDEIIETKRYEYPLTITVELRTESTLTPIKNISNELKFYLTQDQVLFYFGNESKEMLFKHHNEYLNIGYSDYVNDMFYYFLKDRMKTLGPDYGFDPKKYEYTKKFIGPEADKRINEYLKRCKEFDDAEAYRFNKECKAAFGLSGIEFKRMSHEDQMNLVCKKLFNINHNKYIKLPIEERIKIRKANGIEYHTCCHKWVNKEGNAIPNDISYFLMLTPSESI